MRKIIAIGESILDTLFDEQGKPLRAFVGGRIACAAATLGQLQLPVSMVSECATDRVGDTVVSFLERHHVDTRSIDRYTEGTTPLAAIFRDGDGHDTIVNYGAYPKTRFDVIWPRIDEDDIVLFGSLYAIDTPQRERLFELVNYAVQRKAIIIYLPGFQHGINFRITRVMPAILENLEVAHLVIAHTRDIDSIFPGEKSEEAFVNHISFYCDHYLHIAPDLSTTFFHQKERAAVDTACATRNLLGWQAGLTAGIIHQLMERGITHSEFRNVTTATWKAIVAQAAQVAQQCAASEHNVPQ